MKFRSLARRVVLTVTVVFLTPFLQAPATKLAEKLHFDAALADRWEPLMQWLSDLTENPWYIFAVGMTAGTAIGLLLDFVLRDSGSNQAGMKDLKHDPEVPKYVIAEFIKHHCACSDLGTPLEGVRLSNRTYVGAYQQALVLWIHDRYRFYFVSPDPKEGVTVHNDPNIPSDTTLWDEDALRSEFVVPDNLQPPIGGIAKLWRQNIERWKWIGFCEWSMTFEKSTYFQEFKNGMLIGIIPVTVSGDNRAIYVIMNDGKYEIRRTIIPIVKNKVNPSGFLSRLWRSKPAQETQP